MSLITSSVAVKTSPPLPLGLIRIVFFHNLIPFQPLQKKKECSMNRILLHVHANLFEAGEKRSLVSCTACLGIWDKILRRKVSYLVRDFQFWPTIGSQCWSSTQHMHKHCQRRPKNTPIALLLFEVSLNTCENKNDDNARRITINQIEQSPSHKTFRTNGIQTARYQISYCFPKMAYKDRRVRLNCDAF